MRHIVSRKSYVIGKQCMSLLSLDIENLMLRSHDNILKLFLDYIKIIQKITIIEIINQEKLKLKEN